MKKVIRIGEEPKEEKALKPIEFTEILSPSRGWTKGIDLATLYDKVVYLGKDDLNGDCFVAYHGDAIHMFKGHLNDGVY